MNHPAGLQIKKDVIGHAAEAILLSHCHECFKLVRKIGGGRTHIVRFGFDYSEVGEPKIWLREIPDWIITTGNLVGVSVPLDADAITINHYVPGDGINPHVDSLAFGAVWILSLGSGVMMRFRRNLNFNDYVDHWIPERSLTYLNGDSRTEWTHEIESRMQDVVNGERVNRKDRVSIVFRKRL